MRIELFRSTAFSFRRRCDRLKRNAILLLAATCLPSVLAAQAIVPGTGQRVAGGGDDFENPKWTYIYNAPKSSYENDNQQRLPAGGSNNGRWARALKRGQPDVIRRVTTPEDGIPGSTGALLLQSAHTRRAGLVQRHESARRPDRQHGAQRGRLAAAVARTELCGPRLSAAVGSMGTAFRR